MMSAPSSHWRARCIEPVPGSSRLDHVRYCSPFAARLVDRHPEWFEQLQASGRMDQQSPPHSRRADEWIASYGLQDGLRAYRNQEMLRIIWRDLNGLAALGEVFSDLSGLAEVCLAKAVEHHGAELRGVHGEPCDEQGLPQALVVIGLGKLGGEELNLSSDIDVIFSYPEGGHCDSPHGLSNEEFFAKLGRAVIATLGEVRPSGFCFRVDTRLRPFGQAGPIAASFAAMEQYYQREGRDWERYALVKARPVAGDREAGSRLIQSLQPFVYRRYIDFGSIEALREMQAMIRAETVRQDRHNDVKRGAGGIREIEFLAQGFQLLRGGREPSLQTPRLAEALDAIAALGLLPGQLVDRLASHYVTLRQVENRLQAMHDQQTHQLPGGEDLARLASGMGEESAAALVERVEADQAEVSRIFDETWAGPEEMEDGATDAVEIKHWQETWSEWRNSADADSPQRDQQPAYIRSFLSGLGRRPASDRALRRLDRFMPMLLQRMDEYGLSEEATGRLLDLVLVIIQRSAYLALLTENPDALARTVELFGRSPWVAKRVARFPELLDELIDPALGHHIPDGEAIRASATRRLALEDEEAALAGLNYLKQASCLRLAVAWMEGMVDEQALQRSLSGLADAMVDATMRMALQNLEARHGAIEGSGVAVIAYGSLGARELGFDSDLDLVFLYVPGSGESAGKRPLAAERWFARLAQRMVGLLSALTPSGKLYEIDTRLRPNGRSGLLVSSIDAFETYQHQSAWTWEAQALTRARAVTGHTDLMNRFESIRLDCLCEARDKAALAEDLRNMRQRIRESHGAGATPEEAVKHGPGGLVDIGFIAQLGVLSTASDTATVANSTGASEQIRKLHEVGWLNGGQHDLLQSRLGCLRRTRTCLELETEPVGDAEEPGYSGEAVAALLGQLTRS
jgi:glutamate-ammonia-ligase adenylyltransferase